MQIIALLVAAISLAVTRPLTNSLYQTTVQLKASFDYLRQRVVLCIVDPESAIELAQWFAHLPVPVRVAAELDDPQLRQLKELTARDESAFVVVPRSSDVFRRRIMGVLEGDVFDVSLVRVIFVLEPGESLPYDVFPEASCLVVALTGVVVDVAWDQYRNCARRRASSNVPFMDDASSRTWPSLKRRKFTVVTEYTPRPGGVSYNRKTIPEATALFKALLQLNVTVLLKSMFGTRKVESRLYYGIQRKKADISLLPVQLSEEMGSRVYLGAINSFRALAFYSRKGSKTSPHLLPSLLSSGLILASVVFCGLCVTCVYGAQGFLMGRRTGLSGIVLFLTANLLGRGFDLPPSFQYAVTRLLCLLWAFGMMFSCTYLQSVFTSEVSVPTVSRDISTLEDLRRFAQAGKVLPCLERYSYPENFIASSKTGIANLLKQLLQKCPDTCVNSRDMFYCYRLARTGTHVYLGVYDASMSLFASMFDLAPGEDLLRYSPAAAMTPKSFPHGRALRHLVLVLAQSGTVIFEENSLKLNYLRHYFYSKPHDPPVPVAFWEHFGLYFCGNLVAAFCFLLELVWGRIGREGARRRKRRRRAGTTD